MWVFFNDAMLSIVAHKDLPDVLHVRARVPGDIERVFPDAVVTETPHGDYWFRADVSRAYASTRLDMLVHAIEYTNFKGSVKDKERHDVYYRVWDAMWQWQYRLKQRVKRGRGKNKAG